MSKNGLQQTTLWWDPLLSRVLVLVAFPIESRRPPRRDGEIVGEHLPALDKLLRHAKRRRFDVLVCWRLDRLGRNLKHLILFLEELQALGVDFVSLAEGIDATTPAGRLQMHILGAIAEFERARIAERVRLGLARVQAQGQTLGWPRVDLTKAQLGTVKKLGVDRAAQELGISRSTLYRRLFQKPA